MSVELLSKGSLWGEFVWGVDYWQDAVYALPEEMTLGGNPQDLKRDTRDILFNDGTRSEGDEIKGRRLTVTGTVVSDTRDAQRTLMDAIRYQASRPDLRLRLNGADYWAYLAGLISIEEDPQECFDRAVSRVRINWQCDDPFWYSQTEQTHSEDLVGNSTLTVNGLTGGKACGRGQSPVIAITAPAGGSVTSLTLANLTDGGLMFSYSDTQLRNGAQVVIDCYNGTVSRTIGATTTRTERFFDGEFLRLLTKVNTLQYTGNPCNIALTWRPRWL